MDKTKIEWTDATWNPLRGCCRVSEGCRNCYAETVANRFKGPGQPYEGLIASGGQWNGQIKLIPEKLEEPLRWTKPRKVFVNSMSDLFHENVPDEFIDQVFAVMAQCPQHIFQVLTKRPKRMLNYFMRCGLVGASNDLADLTTGNWPLPNVWLGVSVEDQETANERIPYLQKCPAAVRWLSIEPLIDSIDFFECSNHWYQNNYTPWRNAPILADIDWVVVGGESGPHARPMNPEWVRTIRDQCKPANVPFFFKQWGEWLPGEAPAAPENEDYAIFAGKGYRFEGGQWMDRVTKKKAGRTLDGQIWDQYPSQTEWLDIPKFLRREN